MAEATIRRGPKNISAIYLPRNFINDNGLQTGTTYPIEIIGLDSQSESTGTLQASGVIGGFAAMYRAFPNLNDGTTIAIEFEAGTLRVTPPGAATPVPQQSETQYVLDNKGAHRVFIEPYAHGSLKRWKPKGEPDVYMVFGRLAEFTEYRYCCATSVEILQRLGISITPKPDALLIEAGTGRYLVAEFEVNAKKFFEHGHNKDDIDVLVCWENDVPENEQNDLPPHVLCLEDLIEQLLTEGQIEL